ncbi:nucleotidyltransferase [Lapidilactobacillus wuchangensis]|uniref:nucleotidyltransferase n=1 Tax=Lapidilactobacillus wuchangensis TaxID=2486001 RepID=UPI001CDB55A2|nr:nucleotidyltransferase [Lapidilactobacillus wuchangensis]
MMQACGIIAEYNPFHRGHQYQLQQAREKSQADCLIVVMSGNFVQRGEPAIVDKWQRVKQALTYGADLVIELPFALACQPADLFAQGSLAILAALQCQSLAFGTEDANFDYQQFVQKLLPQLDQQQFTVDYQKTYATQWNDFLTTVMGERVTAPNQLLALSYALANAHLATPLKLLPIQRQGADHDQLQVDSAATSASASAIRQLLLQQSPTEIQPFIPYPVAELQPPYVEMAQLWPYLHFRLNTTWPTELASVYQMSEGLEYRFSEQNQVSTSWADFLQRVKSKRYTYARLRRLALYTALNITVADIVQAQSFGPQLRVLGFNQVGQAYLHQQRSQLPVPLLTKVDAKTGAAKGQLGLQVRVDRFYQQLSGREQNFTRRVIMTNKEFKK